MNPHSLVIGGTRGIGRELVRLFQSQGHRVSVLGRRPPTPEDQDLPGVRFWTTDVTESGTLCETLRAAVEQTGPVHHVVFLQRYRGDGDAWSGELATTLTATRNAIEQLADHFAPTGERSIVMVSSIADAHIADGQPAGYHVGKAGLVHLAHYYAVTLGPRGIRVNCVSPGTLLKQENREFYAQNPAITSVLERTIPLGRLGTAADSANVIAFLCSPAARFVTGQTITVDGGVSLLSQESLARRIAGV